MKIFYLIVLVFYSLISLECNSQSKMNESDKFLSWLLKNREEKIICTSPAEISMSKFNQIKNEFTFSEKDSLSIQKKIMENKKAVFHKSLSPDKSFLDKIEIGNTFLKISQPIFFDDGRKVLIYIEHHCGIECGEGSIEVYEIKKLGYTLLYKAEIWES